MENTFEQWANEELSKGDVVPKVKRKKYSKVKVRRTSGGVGGGITTEAGSYITTEGGSTLVKEQ